MNSRKFRGKLIIIPIAVIFFYAVVLLASDLNKIIFDINKINLVDLGVKVFLFHPFHIFMNTSSLSDYTKFKEHYHDLPFLQQYRNLNKKGIRNLFLDLLAYIKSNKIEIKTMDEVNMYYRQNKNENIP